LFFLSALVYPGVLALLCVGAGLAVDRASGGFLPGVLVPAVGVAALIAVCELTTYIPGTAPATPWVLAVVGAGGLALGRPRVRLITRRWREHRWQLVVPVLALVVVLAPVLFAGRPTFSAYMVLTDSALHVMGADYLIRHGQHYAHLDLVNSYGQYIKSYYGNNYPTGADALLGGSAFLLNLPVIWAFQPFNAFVLATASGPAWLLARRLRLDGVWAASAALVATVPALVYAYELIGSIKEITALPLILSMGALVVVHPRWLRGGPRAAIPFALVVAGGVSALGVAFGAWTIVAVAVLVGVAIADGMLARTHARRLLALVGAGAVVLAVCAWPTWQHVSGSVQVAQAVASSPNRGNLVSPLRAIQVVGAWLGGSYQTLPTGASLTITYALITVTTLAALLGALHVLRIREHALASWLALMIVLGFVVTRLGGTWSDAKTLMLSSPIFILLAWGGVAALRGAVHRLAPLLLALVLAGGVLASDFVQYHDSDLAPTARYDELASINSRFAGRGPALFTDFDDYALYELRNLDIGGADFSYPPVGLVGIDSGHGGKVDITRGRAAALRAYPLIITRRDPTAIRPPSAYRLLWQGTYYQVWGRRPGAPAAIARLRLTGTRTVACSRVKAIARVAAAHRATLVAASPAEIVKIDLAAAHRSANWKHVQIWYTMQAQGQLQATFLTHTPGVWNIWLQGEIMPTVDVLVDGHRIGSIGGQLGGDPVVPDTTAPLPVRLSAGRHELSITRGSTSLAPGAGGSAILTSVFLSPAGPGEQEQLHVTPAAQWHSLCGHRYVWIEAVPQDLAARRA
jgi:hypothetical protein